MLLLAILALPFALAANPARAQETAIAELGLDVQAGYSGLVTGSAWTPVEVRLQPTRPVAGVLRVTSLPDSGGGMAVDVPIEVAAASAEVHRVLVPNGTLNVQIIEAGRDPVGVRVDRPGSLSDFLVGYLGELPAQVPSMRSEPTGRSGRWVGVHPAWAEQSALALSPLGTFVATASALSALSPEGQRNVAAATASGTDLVLVADADITPLTATMPWLAGVEGVEINGATITGGPDLWSLRTRDLSRDATAPTNDEIVAVATPAGYGRAVITAVAPGTPDLGSSGEFWSHVTGPPGVGRSGIEQTDWGVTQTPYAFPRLLTDTTTDEGPRLPFLGLFVIAYVLVVGPVNGIVLTRMGRRELAWFTVPIITVVFTAGGFFGATGGRPPAGSSARLAIWNDGAASELVAAGARSTRPDQRTLVFTGDEWTVRPLLDGAEAPRVVRGSDTAVTMELTALQLGGAAAWRSVEAPAPLEIELEPAEAGYSVLITNTGSRALTDVDVRVAGDRTAVGDLPPGASERVEVAGAQLRRLPEYSDSFGPSGLAGPRAPTSLQDALREISLDRPGVLWATAEDDAAPAPPVSGDLDNLGTLVAVGTSLPAPTGGETIPAIAVQRDAISGNDGSDLFRPSPTSIEGASGAFLRFRLPDGGQASQIVNQLGESQNLELTVWNWQDARWDPVDAQLPTSATDADDTAISPLGEVWVRATGELFPFNYSFRTITGAGA